MKDIPWLVLIIYMGNFFIATILVYYIEAYQHETTITTLNEAIKVAGINSYDYSMRVNEGEVLISTKSFEKKVTTLFKRNVGFAIQKGTLALQFEYLSDENAQSNPTTSHKIQAIKAVRVHVSYNNRAPYEITYVANVLK